MKNSRLKFTLNLLLIVPIAGISIYIFILPYNELKKESINSLNEKQHLLAKQVSLGIEDFFRHYTNSVSHLSQHPDIINLNRNGMKLMETYYRFHEKDITAITRVSSTGRLVYTIPYVKSAIGADLSKQEHNSFVMKNQKPVVSEMFKAVQGYNAIAFVVPILEKGLFKGSLTILIASDILARRYCADIRIGEGGYAWMISKKGTELYCPVPGHTGNAIYQTSGRFPTVIDMAKKMMKGEEGTTVYMYDRIKNEVVETIKKHAVYYPVNLPGTNWSVVVATPEPQALEALMSFKNRWLVITLVISMILLSYLYYNIRTRAILKEKTLRLKSEQAMLESEEKFRVIAEQSRMGISILQNNRISFANRAVADMFEYTVEEVMNWGEGEFIKIFHPDYRDFIMEQAKKKQAGEEDIITHYEYRGITKNGREIWVENYSMPVQISGSTADLITSIDITERKKSQELMLQSEKMLTIGNLAAGMAHELNNPLGVIMQGVQVTENRLSPELDRNREVAAKYGIDIDSLKSYIDERGISQYLEGIREAGSRAAKIVSGMLQFSRKSSNEPEKTDLNMLIDSTIDIASKDFDMKKKYDFRNIEITRKFQSPSPIATCIKYEIEQVVLNLLKNSAQAMTKENGKKHEITIKTRADDSEVSFEISDNGPGISEEIMKHIFDPFFTTKEVGEGTGLGLYVCYFIITTHHNGKISVESEPGMGATFRVSLPVN